MAKSADTSEELAGRVLDALIKNTIKYLQKGGEVIIMGFGKFNTVKKKATEGRNPRTGEKMFLPERRVPKFYFDKEFKDGVQRDGEFKN